MIAAFEAIILLVMLFAAVLIYRWLIHSPSPESDEAAFAAERCAKSTEIAAALKQKTTTRPK